LKLLTIYISKFVAFETVRAHSGTTKEDEDKHFFIDRASTGIGQKSME
jgi:hypothetical protein